MDDLDRKRQAGEADPIRQDDGEKTESSGSAPEEERPTDSETALEAFLKETEETEIESEGEGEDKEAPSERQDGEQTVMEPLPEEEAGGSEAEGALFSAQAADDPERATEGALMKDGSVSLGGEAEDLPEISESAEPEIREISQKIEDEGRAIADPSRDQTPEKEAEVTKKASAPEGAENPASAPLPGKKRTGKAAAPEKKGRGKKAEAERAASAGKSTPAHKEKKRPEEPTIHERQGEIEKKLREHEKTRQELRKRIKALETEDEKLREELTRIQEAEKIADEVMDLGLSLDEIRRLLSTEKS